MKQTFYYRARDINGNVLKGTIEADKISTAANLLRKRRLYITKLKPKTVWFPMTGKVSTRELAVFSRQLATLLSAGVPIIRALSILKAQFISKQMQRAIGVVKDSINYGMSMANSMQQLPSIFPNIVVSMVDAGEHGGRLDNILYDLADYLEREQQIKENVKIAVIYPVFILIVAMIMVTFVMVFVLPNYVRMLNQFNLKLPLITQILVNTSGFITHYWYLLLLFFCVLLGSLKMSNNARRIKIIKDTYFLRLPIIGKIYNKLLTARFSNTLALLMRSGVPLLQALTLVKNVVDNVRFAKVIDNALIRLQRGETLASSLGTSNLFHQSAIQMIEIGEQGGNLEQQLALIATVDERDVNVAISKISPLLEPTLLLAASVMVGVIMIAVMLPIFKTLGATASF